MKSRRLVQLELLVAGIIGKVALNPSVDHICAVLKRIFTVSTRSNIGDIDSLKRFV